MADTVWLCGPRGSVDPDWQTCPACGYEGHWWTCRGAVYAAPGELAEIGRGCLARHLGAALFADRCPRCAKTIVLDGLDKDAQEWELDASDYGADGSWPIQQTLW